MGQGRGTRVANILQQALRELKVGEELIVSRQCFRNIRERLQEFRQQNQMLVFTVRPDIGLQRIQRKE